MRRAMQQRPSPLKNRVDPSGYCHTSPSRGEMFGNRGVLHHNYDIVRQWSTKAWLICKIDYKGQRRPLMTPNLYTELFFRDEATALEPSSKTQFT